MEHHRTKTLSAAISPTRSISAPVALCAAYDTFDHGILNFNPTHELIFTLVFMYKADLWPAGKNSHFPFTSSPWFILRRNITFVPAPMPLMPSSALHLIKMTNL